jgi:hypothetical protein
MENKFFYHGQHKITILIIFNLILIVFLLIVGGCSNSVKTKKVYDNHNRPLRISTGGVNEEYSISEWEYKEHTYIIISKIHGGGIAHAGHCKCQGK